MEFPKPCFHQDLQPDEEQDDSGCYSFQNDLETEVVLNKRFSLLALAHYPLIPNPTRKTPPLTSFVKIFEECLIKQVGIASDLEMGTRAGGSTFEDKVESAARISMRNLVDGAEDNGQMEV